MKKIMLKRFSLIYFQACLTKKTQPKPQNFIIRYIVKKKKIRNVRRVMFLFFSPKLIQLQKPSSLQDLFF